MREINWHEAGYQEKVEDAEKRALVRGEYIVEFIREPGTV